MKGNVTLTYSCDMGQTVQKVQKQKAKSQWKLDTFFALNPGSLPS
jgi:hypothetical protein